MCNFQATDSITRVALKSLVLTGLGIAGSGARSMGHSNLWSKDDSIRVSDLDKAE